MGTPVLETMSKDCAGKAEEAEIGRCANRLLRRRLSVSLSSTNCRIVPDAKSAPGPALMKGPKEVILRKAGSGAVSCYPQ